MTAPLSLDLRERLIAAVDGGHPAARRRNGSVWRPRWRYDPKAHLGKKRSISWVGPAGAAMRRLSPPRAREKRLCHAELHHRLGAAPRGLPRRADQRQLGPDHRSQGHSGDPGQLRQFDLQGLFTRSRLRRCRSEPSTCDARTTSRWPRRTCSISSSLPPSTSLASMVGWSVTRMPKLADRHSPPS